ncbi:MAG: DUF2807 domain-containing protein [Bacteroidetes bacterium]|nr:DUF2807 domain-containing protein [Bacteroidota bacterium]
MKIKINSKVNLLLVVVALFLNSCAKTYVGKGDAVAVDRVVGKFSAVILSMDATLYVTDSLEHSCTVNAQQNIQEAIVTRMDGNTLVITSKGTIVSDSPITIYVSMNRAEKFEVNGSGNIIGSNTLKNEKMDFEVNGSGRAQMDVVANYIACAVTGSGNLDLSGRTNSFDVEINGSGKVSAYGLSALTSKAKVTGSGECYVTVGEKLKASVTGSGIIKYQGKPEVVESITGSGIVENTN